MFCPRCGTRNDETARYCTACGTHLGAYRRDVPQSSEPSPSRPAAESAVSAAARPAEPYSPSSPVRRYQRKSTWLIIPVTLILAGVWLWTVYFMPGGLSREAVSWEFAWFFPGFMLLLGLVFTPLYELLQWREVALSPEEVVFRSRGGRVRTAVRPVTGVASVRRGGGVRFEGQGPTGRHIAKTVIRGQLGRRRFREFQEDVGRLFGGRAGPSW